jgi:hypothetical protein
MNKQESIDTQQQALNAVFEDGIWDLYLGAALLPFAIYTQINRLGGGGSLALYFVLPYYILVMALFQLLKKRVTVPRMPLLPKKTEKQVQLPFSKKVLYLVALSPLLLMVLSGLAQGIGSQVVAGLPLISWILGLLILAAGWSFSILFRFHRLLFYGCIAAVSVPVDLVYFARYGWMPLSLAGVAVILAVGVGWLVRFQRRYPLRH